MSVKGIGSRALLVLAACDMVHALEVRLGFAYPVRSNGECQDSSLEGAYV